MSPETYNFERLVGVENKMNDLKLSRESKADAKRFLEASRKKCKMTGKVFRSVQSPVTTLSENETRSVKCKVK